jgi:hypothetical protein
MIFFGTRGKNVSGQVVDSGPCPSCGNTTYNTFGVLRWFHIYWIPMFRTSSKVGMECAHCLRTLFDKDIPNDQTASIRTSVFTKRNTLPLFTGLIVASALFMSSLVTILVAGGLHSATDYAPSYLEQPAVNDIYIVDFTRLFTGADPKFKYGALRVKELFDGQAELQVARIAYNKMSGVRKDIRSRRTSDHSYYESESMFVDVIELKNMQSSGAIRSIRRN